MLSTDLWSVCLSGIYLILCNGYTMARRDLPDIYARALEPAALGLGHIYQANPNWPCMV